MVGHQRDPASGCALCSAATRLPTMASMLQHGVAGCAARRGFVLGVVQSGQIDRHEIGVMGRDHPRGKTPTDLIGGQVFGLARGMRPSLASSSGNRPGVESAASSLASSA
jgi:hypothetical protein